MLLIRACILLFLYQLDSLVAALAVSPSLSLQNTPIAVSQLRNLTLPNTPPGFGVDVVVDNHIHVGLVGSLAIAVEAMYFLTLLPWEGVLRESFPVFTYGINERVIFHPTAPLDADEQMDTQHMVLGLYVGALTIATQGRSEYFALTVTVRMHGDRLGVVYIGPPGQADRGTTIPDRANDTVVLLTADGRPVNMTILTPKVISEDRGILADPNDLHFQIHYRLHSETGPMDPRGVSLAALDFLANAAQFDQANAFRQGSGRDTRTQPSAVVTVQKLVRADPRAGLFKYHHATRGLQLLLRMMTLMEEYYAADFDFEYRGYRFGKGSIKRTRGRLSN